MSNQIRYSVIIPVFNAGSTIERCLESLLHHIPENAELLVINDGSRDNSGLLCAQYADKYTAIRYFEKPNGGVSSARNVGLDQAKGDYILFSDSDDYVVPDFWDTVTSLLGEQNVDLLQYGFRDCGEKSIDRNNGNYYVDSDVAVAGKIDEAVRAYAFSALYARAFRNDIIQSNNLRFDTNLAIGEDQVFIFQYGMHVKNIRSIEKTLYNAILDNQESLTRKKREYLVRQLRQVNKKLFAAIDSTNFDRKIAGIYEASVTWVYYRSVYSCCKELLKYDLSEKQRREKIKKICRLYGRDRIRPKGIKCTAIAIPVLLRMSRVINILISRA